MISCQKTIKMDDMKYCEFEGCPYKHEWQNMHHIINVHHQKKDFNCDCCQKSFGWSSNLQRHIEIVNGSSYVVGMSIEKMWRNDEMTNFGIFTQPIPMFFFLKYKTETAKTVQRQLHILHNISKFRHFFISSHLFYWHANHIRDF